MTLKDYLPKDAEDVLALAPEEMAEGLFAFLCSPAGRAYAHRYNISLGHVFSEYPQESRDKLNGALMEAWMCLERDGLIAPRPGDSSGLSYFITRAGARLAAGDVSWREIRAARHLPRGLLHPTIERVVRPEFVRGDYEIAVFKAFRAVEIAVREAAGLTDSDLGQDLMRTAFNRDGGPLTDESIERGEQDGMSHLFAGAIQLFKNPGSHRYVRTDDPAAVMEEIMLASRLLRIVDERRKARSEEDKR